MRGSEVVRHVRKETGLVGRNVESLRKAQGLSKTCLSAMAGVCRQELAKVEKGEVSATLGTLVRLADALDVASTTCSPSRRASKGLASAAPAGALLRHERNTPDDVRRSLDGGHAPPLVFVGAERL